jgi:hypothetical protein
MVEIDMFELSLSAGESAGIGVGLLSSWSPLRAFNTRENKYCDCIS